MTPLFYILSLKRGLWEGRAVFWGPNKSGYTTNLDRAGLYPEEEADAICAQPHGLKPTAMKVLANSVSGLIEKTVDGGLLMAQLGIQYEAE